MENNQEKPNQMQTPVTPPANEQVPVMDPLKLMFSGTGIDPEKLSQQLKGAKEAGGAAAPAKPNEPAQPPAAAPETPAQAATPDEATEELPVTVFSKRQPSSIEFKDIDEALGFLSKETGIEVKSTNDISKVTEQYKVLKDENSNLLTTAAKADRYEKFLSELPDDLHSILSAYDIGEDYRKVMQSLTSSSFDFSKDFTDHSEFSILSMYFPEKFSSKEDYLEKRESEPDFIKVWADLAKEKYNIDRVNFEKNRNAAIDRVKGVRKQSDTAIKSSIDSSMNYLMQQAPSLDDKQKKEVSELLEGGPSVLLGLFYDNNGLPRKEAAELITLLKYGKDTIAAQQKYIENRATSKANEDILSRGKDNPNPAKPASEANQTVNTDKIKDFVNTVIPKTDKVWK